MAEAVPFPLHLRELRRTRRPEKLVAAGLLIAGVGSGARAAYAALALPFADGATAVIVFAVAGFFGVGIVLVLRRRASRAEGYLPAALLATAMLFTADPAALIGGGLALLGAVWGLLETW